MTFHVLHYQESGVAAVPWRIQQLVGRDTVHLYGRGSRIQQHYGLPVQMREAHSAAHAVSLFEETSGNVPEIVHLHHDWVATRHIDEVRQKHPACKVVVTCHGEPDRTRFQRGAGPASLPDAYHAVSADLVKRLSDSGRQVSYIPNHPGPALYQLDDQPERAVCKRLLVPWSAVSRFKNHEVLGHVGHALMRSGWQITRQERTRTNGAMLRDLLTHDACWVQLQGYAPDILTMECWALGCTPIVLCPDRAQIKAQIEFWGTQPRYLFVERRPEHIVTLLDSEPGLLREAAEYNERFMRTTWSADAARATWLRFYQDLLP